MRLFASWCWCVFWDVGERVQIKVQAERLDAEEAGMNNLVRVWPRVHAGSLPELNPSLWDGPIFSEKQLRFSSGIAISGGGARSYVQTLGALKALDAKNGKVGNILEHVRWVTSVSGGTWSVASYLYYQTPERDQIPVDTDHIDDELMLYTTAKKFDYPPIRTPSRWSSTWLRFNGEDFDVQFTGRERGPLKTMRTLRGPHYSNGTLPSPSNLVFAYADDHAYLRWVHYHFLAPANIPKDSVMAASEGHAARLRQWVNPLMKRSSTFSSFSKEDDKSLPSAMEKVDVIKPGKQLPLFVPIGSALGPVSSAPADFHNAQFSSMEFNPLYSGFLFDSSRTWKSRSGATTTRRLSGAVETAFFGGVVVEDGGVRNFSAGVLDVTMNSIAPWRLSDANLISSWGPAGKWFRPTDDSASKFMAYASKLAQTTSQLTMFDTKSHTIQSEGFVLGDAGTSSNVPIINLLQRQVKCVAAFWWQIYGRDIEWWREFVQSGGSARPHYGQIDYDLAAFFGVLLTDYDIQCGNAGCDLRHNQVFETDQLVVLIKEFLRLYDAGQYMVHRMRLWTMKNDYLGVPSYEVEVIFSYASTSADFIRQVEETESARRLTVPADHDSGGNASYPSQFDFEKHFNQPWIAKYGFPFPMGQTVAVSSQPMRDLDTWMLYQNAGNSVLANLNLYGNLINPGGFCAS